jgi:hypothetical protein
LEGFLEGLEVVLKTFVLERHSSLGEPKFRGLEVLRAISYISSYVLTEVTIVTSNP